jgi:hypothetical protein
MVFSLSPFKAPEVSCFLYKNRTMLGVIIEINGIIKKYYHI